MYLSCLGARNHLSTAMAGETPTRATTTCRTLAVVRQDSDRAGNIDDFYPGLDPPRLDAPPPRSPLADVPHGHALSTRPGDREPGPPSTARHPGRAETPRHPARGPGLLGPAAPGLEPMGRSPRHRPAGHGRALAPFGVSHLLELAVPTRKALRPSSPAPGGPSTHPDDGHRESWGASRIHGELLCLGFDVSERSASRYLRSFPRTPRSNPTWPTFRNERQLRQLIESFVTYYNVDRTHIGVGKDSPYSRPVEQRPGATSHVVSLPRVGGLHHRYAWRQAA